MRDKSVGYKDARWVAYDAADCEHELFATYDDAAEWLKDRNDDGISEETEAGYSYIAKITHRTAMEVTDRKENYHVHTDDCGDDCTGEEWPYDSDYDYVGTVYMKPVDDDKEAPLAN